MAETYTARIEILVQADTPEAAVDRAYILADVARERLDRSARVGEITDNTGTPITK